jgi:hypothetical protein
MTKAEHARILAHYAGAVRKLATSKGCSDDLRKEIHQLADKLQGAAGKAGKS